MKLIENAGIYDLRFLPKPIVFGFPEGSDSDNAETDDNDTDQDDGSTPANDDQSAGR